MVQVKVIDDEEYEKNKNFFLEMGEPQLLEMSERKGGAFPSQALVPTLYPLTPPPFHSPCMAPPTGSILLLCVRSDLLYWVYMDKGHIYILHGAFSQSWSKRNTVIDRFSYPPDSLFWYFFIVTFHPYLYNGRVYIS